MELKNSTDFPDWFLRRMISFICKSEYMEWSVKKVRAAEFRNRTNRRYSGHAWPWRGRIVVSVGNRNVFRPVLRDDEGKVIRTESGIARGEPDQNERTRILVMVAAHEVAHLTQVGKPRRRGKYSEKEADWKADRVLDEFMARRDELIAEWEKPPAYATKPKKAQPTAQEKRYARAQNNLANWERKAKLAATKLKKYRKQVRYYEKALGVDAEAAKKGK